MKVGYARVSTNDQDTQLQMDALNSVGCNRIYEEKQFRRQKGQARITTMLEVAQGRGPIDRLETGPAGSQPTAFD